MDVIRRIDNLAREEADQDMTGRKMRQVYFSLAKLTNRQSADNLISNLLHVTRAGANTCCAEKGGKIKSKYSNFLPSDLREN